MVAAANLKKLRESQRLQTWEAAGGLGTALHLASIFLDGVVAWT